MIQTVCILTLINFRPFTLYKVMIRHKLGGMFGAISAAICWITFIVLMILEIIGQHTSLEVKGMYSLAWVFYLGFVTIITVTRAQIRSFYDISGNPIEDFFAVMFIYPSVMVQLDNVHKEDGLAPLMPDDPEKQNIINAKAVDNSKV